MYLSKDRATTFNHKTEPIEPILSPNLGRYMSSIQPRQWIKKITLLLVILLTLTVAFPAQAFVCRTLGDQSVCIVQIQRSAKYHWEYRVVLRIDGVDQPLERYNCRDRLRVQTNGTRVSFDEKGVGDLICRLVK